MSDRCGVGLTDPAQTKPDDPKPTDPEPTTPPAETISASGTAVASTQKVTVDGKALGFNVGWSKEAGVFIESDKPYTE